LNISTLLIAPDKRPMSILYNGPLIEVTICISGAYDCNEFSDIRNIFSYPSRPKLNVYKESLTNLLLHTNINKSKYELITSNTIKIEAFDGNNNHKKYGGDFWIVRLHSGSQIKPPNPPHYGLDNDGIYVGPLEKFDYDNGTYLFQFPNLNYYTSLQFSKSILPFKWEVIPRVELSKTILSNFIRIYDFRSRCIYLLVSSDPDTYT